ncbi:ABC transporter substrate-binding protein [Kordiimonas sp. SCSIO 12610]|uniref:substrate-binding periplasmic protein n=1 Tax=Kordiimonas sp. SCSIO 12610 TaxID=2829597 RepID=UPI00210906B1|nr:transporter substrate-binding domain-containing protein [Kordiimonas sp. SCSIO 12610]UTW55706.1 transporter substrate-binding domain-containing protein [Kordiimonas sp. SCSIO 12610]
MITKRYKLPMSWLIAANVSMFGISGSAYSIPFEANHSALLLKETNTIRVAGTFIPGVFDGGDSGLYNRLFQTVANEYSEKISFDMYPIRRAVKMMKDQEADCLFVANDSRDFHTQLGFPTDKLIFSDPVYVNRMKVYSRALDGNISAIADLKGANVAVSSGTYQGYWFQEHVPNSVNVTEVNDLKQAFDLLKIGRVDHVISFSLDAQLYLDSVSQSELFHSNADLDIVITRECIVCWGSEKSSQFINYVNQQINEAQLKQ